MTDAQRLAELGRQLEAAKERQQAAARKAIETSATEDYKAAMEAAEVVDRIWQDYSALWRKLHAK